MDQAKVASSQGWFAYVWPAVALTPADRLLARLQARLRTAAVLAAPDLLPQLSPLTAVTGVAEAGVAGVPERSPGAGPGPEESPGIPLPSGNPISALILILVCGALIALLGFTVKREVGPARRWRL